MTFPLTAGNATDYVVWPTLEDVHASDTSSELILVSGRLRGGASCDVIVLPSLVPVLDSLLSD